MFIELHRLDGTAITININRIEYFAPAVNGDSKGTGVSIINNVDNANGWFFVTDSYDQVKEKIIECQKR